MERPPQNSSQQPATRLRALLPRVLQSAWPRRRATTSFRDAETAYLQAVIDTPTRTPTFVELPREWWADSCFKDGASRWIPKYDRLHCRLKQARHGHPEAGALWEARLDDIMKNLGLSAMKGIGGTHTRTPKPALQWLSAWTT